VSAALTPGATFAGYRVEALVGRGGMGVVYRATDLSLERPVALKLVAPELADDESFRARFLKEPRLAAALDHPNVVPIYEAGQRDGQLYLAMRYVEGDDLGTILEREGSLPPERVLPILRQIADALDAAHRRGLVHRDVKPANMLLDEDGHAYLTDFGITKRLGGASTDTGRMVGTLDYLAPEQIRGDPVDGRTDCYALACVLYECLAGAPPFRRETEAETMWAHMQEQAPPLRGRPALDPVLRKAMAKEKDDRYARCSELIEAAGQALGLAAPATHRRSRIPAWLRRPRAVLVAGLLVLGLAIAAGVVALTSGGDGSEAPVGNGIAAIGAGDDEVGAFVESATAPSNIAVGEGAVWYLNTQDETVSRLDPKTKAVTGSLRTRGVSTDLAAGAGAVWVGNSGSGSGGGGNYTVSISRIDPKTSKTTHTLKLPSRGPADALATFNWGFPDIAVGDGAVWAVNPDGTVSRIDPDTGRLVEVIDVVAGGSIAAGKEGVWFVDDEGPAVVRIDPRTNRHGQRIPVGAQDITGIAVGAGSVWTTAEREGVVWRVEPGPSPVTRTIDVGPGVTYIAYGAGAVWAANFIDGTVSKIDPRTNSVTARIPIGAAQALAAGEGSAWVSTAGGTQAGGLPETVCGQLESGGGEPDVLIASDLPLQGPNGAGPRAMADALRHVLRRRGFRAGKHAVGYRSCDDSTAQTGAYEDRRCAANANAYAEAEELVAVIGPFNSGCAQIEVPIVNRAPDGPVAMIGPTLTHPGLTRQAGPPADGYRGEPDIYYPTGVRNLVRLKPGDDLMGVAHAVLARRLGLDSVYVLDDGPDFWKGLQSDPFRDAARRLGVDIAGSASYDPRAESYDKLAERIARTGAEGVVVGGDPFDGGDRLVRALRARLGEQATIMGGFFFAFVPDVLEAVGPAARGMYVTTLDLPLTALPLTAAGRRFARDVGALTNPTYGVLEAGQAAELMLDAIARSDGTRASVLEELRESEVRRGIMGSFGFDRNGDITTASVPILRITGSTPPSSGLPPQFQGAVIDRVVQVPASLVR
jgi:ABC-type branched-subunit amino acid transport system substrate-binding protein/DNA-binding beta-propeller fold protein YncE